MQRNASTKIRQINDCDNPKMGKELIIVNNESNYCQKPFETSVNYDHFVWMQSTKLLKENNISLKLEDEIA